MSCCLIFLTASLVNLQQLVIEFDTSQLTITLHEILDLVVFSSAFIRPSNATIGLLLPTDLQECVFRNLWHKSRCVISSWQCCTQVLISINAYLLAAAPPLQDAQRALPLPHAVRMFLTIKSTTRKVPLPFYFPIVPLLISRRHSPLRLSTRMLRH
jgi:hypothetical protein